MTWLELTVLALCLMAAFRSFPKRGRKAPKRRKPLPRRGPFRPKDNLFKAYREPSANMKAVAAQRRSERLAKATLAEERFQVLLKDLGFVEGRDYERESICFYPGSFCLFDYFFRARKLAFELDGSAHDDRGQKNHDEGRDLYFARQGIRTVRIKNRIVLGFPDVCRRIVLAELQH